MNILFISRWFPFPTNNGSKLRIYNLLCSLARDHEITLISFADQRDGTPDISTLRSICSDVQVVPWKPFQRERWRACLGFFNSTPRSVVDTYSLEMEQHIERALAKLNYDLIIASQWEVAGYSHCFRERPALFEEVEIGVPYGEFVRASSIWSKVRMGLTWTKYRRYITRLSAHYQTCTVVSEQERDLLSRVVPQYKAIEVVPNCINLADYETVTKTLQPNSLIFTGSFRYSANYDAMIWFLREVYPCIQAQVPDLGLTITGDHANRPLPNAQSLNLTGFVNDVRPLIASASISLAPLRIGGGTRLKILEAMALRTPVVATSKGAEGLDAQSGKHLLVADTPQAFANAVIHILKEPELGQQLTDNAYQLVTEKYNWATVMPRFLSLVDRVARA